MSDLQLRYSGDRIAVLENAVRLAVIGIGESIANDMAILTKNTNEAHAKRAQRKWYQFWNHWWGWDTIGYELNDYGQMERWWKNRSNNQLTNLQNKLEKLRPTEIILTEELSNMIIRYAKL
jgi:hypothetical protein